MIWRVPYGFYKKNFVKIYLIFFIIFILMAILGWFVKESFKIEEMQAAAVIFVVSAGLLFIILPLIFQKGIVEYIREWKEQNKPTL